MVHISLIIDIKISRLSITESVNVEDAAWFRITEIADIVSLSFLGLYTETKNVRDDFGRASEKLTHMRRDPMQLVLGRKNHKHDFIKELVRATLRAASGGCKESTIIQKYQQ